MMVSSGEIHGSEGERVGMGKRERTRRQFTPEYKLGIVEEARKCSNRGEIGRLLEREGLSYSQLSVWRRAARSGAMKALGRKRGPKPSIGPSLTQQIRELKRDHERVREELREARAILVAHRNVLRDRAADPDDLPWPKD